MNGVTRGARLFALLDREPCAVIVLDRGPDGWWVSFEDHLTPTGHPLVEQRSVRHLYPTRAGALDGAKVGNHA